MCAFVLLSNHLRGGFLEAVWVHGGHEVDAGIVDEVDDGLIALLVLVAKVLSQVDEQLSAHSLVAVHVGDVLKLRLTCREKKPIVVLLRHRQSYRIIPQHVFNPHLYSMLMGSERKAEHKQLTTKCHNLCKKGPFKSVFTDTNICFISFGQAIDKAFTFVREVTLDTYTLRLFNTGSTHSSSDKHSDSSAERLNRIAVQNSIWRIMAEIIE